MRMFTVLKGGWGLAMVGLLASTGCVADTPGNSGTPYRPDRGDDASGADPWQPE